MAFLEGFAGLYQAPLMSLRTTSDAMTMSKRHSVYCIASEDMKTLTLIPLVQNFFETAFLIARHMSYQKIYLILPSLDMVFISDAYQLFYELRELHKDVIIISTTVPQRIVTDDFYANVLAVGYNMQYQLAGYNIDATSFDVLIRFPMEFRPDTRLGSDIVVSTNKTTLFSMKTTQNKLETLAEADEYDVIQMPFAKNIYGGLPYIIARRDAHTKIRQKLYAYGFQSVDEFNTCRTIGGKCSEVIYDGLV